ncbi:MAG: hypothetical protein IKT55_00285 [Clostridia bacterium]|nr:hypothetical protein [Clostridia bacterium]
MLKGVNKQVLEIAETENGFFEKAIFFVKPEYSGMSEGRLRESARREIESVGKPPLSKSFATQRKQLLLTLCGSFVAGIVAGVIFRSLF